MTSRKYSLESLAYLLAFLLALALRFAALARLPLNDQEAALALQSLSVARGTPIELGPQPGYVMLTGALFFLTQATNFTARFWPALAGSLLAIAPFFFRRSLGRGAALFLAFALALDPALAALSREANSSILALTFVLLAAGCYFERSSAWAGIFAGLGLLGGQYLWPGIIAVALAAWVSGSFRKPAESVAEEIPDPSLADTGPLVLSRPFDLRRAAVAFVLTLLAAGTLFLRWPSGLSAMVASLPAYLSTWVTPTLISPVLMVLALILYQPLALILGLWGGFGGLARRDPLDRFLLLWWLIALVLAMINPGRQVPDVAWSLIPIWALAARQGVRLFALTLDAREMLTPTLYQALLAFVLLVFIWMSLAAIANPDLSEESTVRLAAIGGALVLLILTSLLMRIGWSAVAMRSGLIWGLGLVIILYSVSATWHSAGLSKETTAEFYRSAAAIKDDDLLVRTLGTLAMEHNGNRNVVDVVVAGISSPALKWSLRDVDSVTFVDALPPASEPSIVITSDQQKNLAAASAYRGEAFVWNYAPAWNVMVGDEWLRWLTQRIAPYDKTMILLWGRTDMFYGGTLPAQATQP